MGFSSREARLAGRVREGEARIQWLTLQLENTQLAFINERLKDEIKHLKVSTKDNSSESKGNIGDQTATVNDALAQSTIAMLEKKLFAIQEELTELHRRKGIT